MLLQGLTGSRSKKNRKKKKKNTRLAIALGSDRNVKLWVKNPQGGVVSLSVSGSNVAMQISQEAAWRKISDKLFRTRRVGLFVNERGPSARPER